MSVVCACGCGRIGEAWKFTDRGPLLRLCAIKASHVRIVYTVKGEDFVETLKFVPQLFENKAAPDTAATGRG